MEILKLKDKIYNQIIVHFVEKSIKKNTGLDVNILLDQLVVTENDDHSVTASINGSITARSKNELTMLLNI